MKKILLAAVMLPLSGCVAAAVPAYMAASYAFSAFSVYKMYSLGNIKGAKYEVQKSDPDAADLQAIKSAATLAVFPTNSSIDGVVVDTLAERTSFDVISSKVTIETIESQGVTQEKLLSYPSVDRSIELQKFGSQVGADVILLPIVGSSQATGMGYFSTNAGTETAINVKLYDTATGRVLLEEEHKIVLDLGSAPSNDELAQLAAMGIGDRLEELKVGLPREEAFLPVMPEPAFQSAALD